MFTKSDTVAIRLSATEREKFMKQYGAPQLEQYGVVQKEYVVVPDDLLRQTELLLPWFQLSYNYAASLKPKAAAGSAGKKKK